MIPPSPRETLERALREAVRALRRRGDVEEAIASVVSRFELDEAATDELRRKLSRMRDLSR